MNTKTIGWTATALFLFLAFWLLSLGQVAAALGYAICIAFTLPPANQIINQIKHNHKAKNSNYIHSDIALTEETALFAGLVLSLILTMLVFN